jgi:hypothetical protein
MENIISEYNRNRDAAAELLNKHKRGKAVCYSNDDIHLIQTGANAFTVIYFLQVTTGLDYSSAAMELGSCIMHQAACNSLLDNGA